LDSIGLRLKRARESRNLSVEQVVKATRIRAQYIDAMEADRPDDLPSPAAVRGFLRVYSEYLGLSLQEIIDSQKVPAADEQPHLPAEVIPDQPPASNDIAGTDNAETDHASSQIESDLEPAPAMYAEALPVTIIQEDNRMAATASQSIFHSIGQELSRRRELLGLSLDEIERHTHIRLHYLLAMETGEIDRLPSSVQGRGMLQNYAHFLELDLDAILLRYAEGLQALLDERRPRITLELQEENPTRILWGGLKKLISGDLVFGGGLLLVILVFAIWGTIRILSQPSTTSGEATPGDSVTDALVDTPTASLGAAIAAPDTSLSTHPTTENGTPVAMPSPGNRPVQVYIIARERTWMRVTVDDVIKFEGRTLPGGAYPFDGNQRIEILSGNAAALQILWNQANVGALGLSGEIVNLIFTANGIQTPTPTATLPPTATSPTTPTATATPTKVITPTLTPRP